MLEGMAQDPAEEEGLNTHALDMVTLPNGSVMTEMEADVIRGVLDANGIPSLVVTAPEIPSLGFEVKVPRGRVAEAERLVQEALAIGTEGATEAEAQGQ
jgi:hypothetical protein